MTKRCICFISFILSLAILLHVSIRFADSRRSSKHHALQLAPRKADDFVIPDGSTDRLFWFIQVRSTKVFYIIYLAFRSSLKSI